MSDGRAASAAIIGRVVPLVANIWHTNPFEHPLAQITNGDPNLAQESARELEAMLQEALSSVYSKSDHELMGLLRASSSVADWLPTWQPLVFATYQVLVTRYDSARASRMMVGLNVPRRDIMERNSGTIHDQRPSQGISNQG